MQSKDLQFKTDFQIVLGDEHSQAAEMTLAPGDAEGGENNRHRAADQWLFVFSGGGLAIVNGQHVPLREGTLLFIKRGQFRNTGSAPLRTVNFYVPPAYDEQGGPLPAGRP